MTSVGGDLLAWNSNGNLDNSVNASFTYDFDNKLRFATADSNSIEIRYDPRGNRIYKGIRDSEGDIIKERKYIVDIVGRLPVILCEIDPNNSSLTNKYYYANSQILAQDAAYLTDPNDPNSTDYNRYYYLHDRLGSVRQVVDCNALTVATYTYNPYGEDFAEDCNDVAIYNPFKYTGQWFDSEIAQYYLRARQYDPQLMRFSGRDPEKGKYKEPLTLHAYLYCKSNPVNYVDPSGRILGLVTVLFGTSESSSMRAADNRRVMQGAAAATVALTGLYYINMQHNYGIGLTASGLEHGLDSIFSIGIGVLSSVRDFWDPTVSPGDGFDWRGKGDPESGDGSWYNPDTGETFHPDLDHPWPIGPHIDYTDPDGNDWRIDEDGVMEPKNA